MKIIIVAGFLGSGKTSLIVDVAREFSSRGNKTVVLENEISSSGVDSDFIESNGIYVKELAAGCICCRLKADFMVALKELQEEFSPDVILVEPTGAAAPDHVKESLCNSTFEIPLVVSIVDLWRFKSIGLKQYPFLEQTIRIADIVLLNKADLVNDSIVSAMSQECRGLNDRAEILPVSALKGTNMHKLADLLGNSKGCNRTVSPDSDEKLEKPATVALEKMLTGTNIDAIREKMKSFANILQNDGCRSVGHIKTVLTDNSGRTAFLSLTDFNRDMDCRAASGFSVNGTFAVKLNAVVYGVKASTLQYAVNECFNKTA